MAASFTPWNRPSFTPLTLFSFDPTIHPTFSNAQVSHKQNLCLHGPSIGYLVAVSCRLQSIKISKYIASSDDLNSQQLENSSFASSSLQELGASLVSFEVTMINERLMTLQLHHSRQRAPASRIICKPLFFFSLSLSQENRLCTIWSEMVQSIGGLEASPAWSSFLN